MAVYLILFSPVLARSKYFCCCLYYYHYYSALFALTFLKQFILFCDWRVRVNGVGVRITIDVPAVTAAGEGCAEPGHEGGTEC